MRRGVRSAFVLLAVMGVLGPPSGTRAGLQPQQVSGCPTVYSNATRVHTRYADLQEVYDDLHTLAAAPGRLCGFEIYLRNSSTTETIMAEVTFYANGPTDAPPAEITAGPYQVPIPANHNGVIQVDTPTGTIEEHMWVGVRFLNVPLDGQGFVGLVDGPPQAGSSHNILYSKEVGNYIEFGGRNADFYIVVYSSAPRSVEDSTWGKVKNTYR